MSKKVISSCAFLIAAIFLYGCGQKQTGQIQPQSQMPKNQNQQPPIAAAQSVAIPKADASDYNITINPADFVSAIDNKYFTLKPGSVITYKGKKDNAVVVDSNEVTKDTKDILGIKTVVVKDTITENDKITEISYDWFAQDKNGTVWSFGEDMKEYDATGKVTNTIGSWEAGKSGALPGVVMTANPQLGDSWKQEYLKGIAEDRGEILGIDETIKTAYGSYQHCVKTKDWSAVEPGVIENKYYCQDNSSNVVSIKTVQGGNEYSELASITQK